MAAHQSVLVEQPEAGWVAAGDYTQAVGASSVNLVPYLHGLRRHWVVAISLGVLCGVLLAAAVWFGWGAQYSPTALLNVATTRDTLVFATADGQQRLTEYAFDIYKDTQRQLVTSPFVLNAALRDTKINTLPSVHPDNNPDPVVWLQKKLRVGFPGDAEIMQISLKGRDPAEASALVNAVLDAYMKEVVEMEHNRRRSRLSELDGVYTEKEEDVRKKRNEVRKMASDLGTAEADALALKQRMAIQEVSDYQRQLSQTTFELNRSKGALQMQKLLLDNVDSMKISELELDQYAQADPVTQHLAEMLANKAVLYEYAMDAGRGGASSRHLSQKEDDLFRIQARLDELSQGLKEAIVSQKRSKIEEELQRREIEVGVLEGQQKTLLQDVTRKRREADKLSRSTIDLEMLRAEVVEISGVLADISKEREALGVEVNTRSRINVIQRSEPPKSSVNLSARVALSILIMIVGICIPGVCIAWWDVRSQRINSSEDVSKGLGLTVIGSMPMIPARVLRQLSSAPGRHQAWHMRLTESVDGTVARLLRKAELEQTRVILVTSPTGGEGKTTLATQLALSFTRNGRRTVLVDFDLRQPALDQAFELTLEPGISEVLRQEIELAEVIQETGTDNLSVVAAGRWDRQALAALANGGAGPIFESLREEAEFIVIDASAVLPVADTRFVSQHVDTVLLSIFRDVSQAHKVRAACEILDAFGVRSLEAVVTCPTDHLRGRNLKFEAGMSG